MELTHDAIAAISRDNPPWLAQLRERAWNQYYTSHSTTFRYGLTIKYHIAALTQPLHLPTQESIEVTQAPQGTIIMDLHEALRAHPYLLEKHLFAWNRPGHEHINTKAGAFHIAAMKSLLFIEIPQNSTIESPIRMRSILSGRTRIDTIFIRMGKNSSAQFELESTGSPAEPGLRSCHVQILAEDGSTCSFTEIQDLGNQAVNFERMTALVGESARVDWLICTLGSAITKSDTITWLKGKASTANNYSLSLCGSNQTFDLSGSAIHEGEESVSDTKARGAVRNNGTSIYRGLVRIEENAHRSNGYQKIDGLIMDKTAHAHAVPDLEINNHDVRCTHGAALSQPDPEHLFYLQSRGLSHTHARKALIMGFYRSLLTAHTAELQEKIEKQIEQRWNNA